MITTTKHRLMDMNGFEVRTYCPKNKLMLRSLITNESSFERFKCDQENVIKYKSTRLTFYKNKAKMRGFDFHQRIWDRLLKEIRYTK